jgi:hypothetical protein
MSAPSWRHHVPETVQERERESVCVSVYSRGVLVPLVEIIKRKLFLFIEASRERRVGSIGHWCHCFNERVKQCTDHTVLTLAECGLLDCVFFLSPVFVSLFISLLFSLASACLPPAFLPVPYTYLPTIYKKNASLFGFERWLSHHLETIHVPVWNLSLFKPFFDSSCQHVPHARFKVFMRLRY